MSDKKKKAKEKEKRTLPIAWLLNDKYSSKELKVNDIVHVCDEVHGYYFVKKVEDSLETTDLIAVEKKDVNTLLDLDDMDNYLKENNVEPPPLVLTANKHSFTEVVFENNKQDKVSFDAKGFHDNPSERMLVDMEFGELDKKESSMFRVIISRDIEAEESQMFGSKKKKLYKATILKF